MLLDVGRQKAARVIARQAERGLRQIVGAKREEFRLQRQLIGEQRGTRQLDHRSEIELHDAAETLEGLVRDLVDDLAHYPQLGGAERERDHDLWVNVQA